MSAIKVLVIDESRYQVTVVAASTTTHDVAVDQHYALKLTAGKISTAQLVEKSFEFMLARESNTSILRSFNLSVIVRYFPEYENEIKQQ
jgi:hypothetical protein